MKKECDIFLKSYKKLEEVLTKEGKTIYEFEQELDQTAGKKLQLCRLTRNFLQHENDIFITPTVEMISFIDAQVLSLESKYLHVKDKMTRQTALLWTEKMKDAAAKLPKKITGIPVIDPDKNFFGLLVPESVITSISEGKFGKSLKSQLEYLIKPNGILKPDMLLENIHSGIYVVTSDGTESGKYRGVLIIP